MSVAEVLQHLPALIAALTAAVVAFRAPGKARAELRKAQLLRAAIEQRQTELDKTVMAEVSAALEAALTGENAECKLLRRRVNELAAELEIFRHDFHPLNRGNMIKRLEEIGRHVQDIHEATGKFKNISEGDAAKVLTEVDDDKQK